MGLSERRLQALRQELLVVNRDLEEVDHDIVTWREDEQPRNNVGGSNDETTVVLYHSDPSEDSGSIRTEISI